MTTGYFSFDKGGKRIAVSYEVPDDGVVTLKFYQKIGDRVALVGVELTYDWQDVQTRHWLPEWVAGEEIPIEIMKILA